MIRRLLLATAAGVLASSCAREAVTTPAVMTPVSPEVVLARGVAITAKAFATLSGELQAAMAAGGVTNALSEHGEPGVDIAPADGERIRGLYPADTATGFKAGEVRGMWRVEFPAGAFRP